MKNQWVFLGGLHNQLQSNKIHVLNLDTFVWKNSCFSLPQSIDSHTAVLTEANQIILYGGYLGPHKSSILFSIILNEKPIIKEIKPKGVQPPPRTNHTAAYFENNMYIFGGSGGECEKLADLWKFDITQETWTLISDGTETPTSGIWPRPRSGHSCVVMGEKMHIFGGILGMIQETNDSIYFDMKAGDWNYVHPAELVPSIEERLSPCTALREVKLLEEAKRKMSATGYESPKGKSFKTDYFRMLQQASVELSSPLLKKKAKKSVDSDEDSPHDSPKYYKTHRRFESVTDRQTRHFEDEVSSPIVLTMRNSVVMKARNQNRRKPFQGEAQMEKGKVVGNFPCGRDGHASIIYKDNMYIFGGDRYQMAYNDLYSYPLS